VRQKTAPFYFFGIALSKLHLLRQFLAQHKDALQKRLMFFCHFVPSLLGYVCTNNYSNKERFDQVIAKIK